MPFGLGAKRIGKKLGRNFTLVQKWIYRYNQEGFEGLLDKPRSGAPRKLNTARELEFRDRIIAGPQEQDEVSVWRGKSIIKLLLPMKLF
ncbi:helix-turn-helix domain-containing protein [Candidatus Riflebacteria bacterium]